MRNDREQPDSIDVARALAHDLRHSLFALRTGIDLLPQVKENAAEFNEVHALLQQEIVKASELARKVLNGRDESAS